MHNGRGWGRSGLSDLERGEGLDGHGLVFFITVRCDLSGPWLASWFVFIPPRPFPQTGLARREGVCHHQVGGLIAAAVQRCG